MGKVEVVSNIKLNTTPGNQEQASKKETPDDGFDEVFQKELRRNDDEIYGKSRR